ncbi:MAG: DEAD/DEAH box helicase [Gemmataceae bacterium]
MIILHAGAENGLWWLWAEQPAVDSSPGKADPRPYPYDAGPQHLVATLLQFAPGHPIPGGGRTPFLWVPTSSDGLAIPSSGLIADVLPTAPLRLRPYSITALPLSPAMMLDLLCACVSKETLAPGVLIGSTLAFWTRLLQFTGALVGREKLVPGVQSSGSTLRAVWQPVVTGPDSQRLGRLLQAMPPACRALSHSSEQPPERPAAEEASEFLNRMTDLLVRTALHGPVHLAAKSGRVAVAKKSPTLHDAWLAALYSLDGNLALDDKQAAELAEQIRSWQRPIRSSADSAFQLCLRLEEPAESAPEEAAWRLNYLLQARDDPSLLLPLAEVWKPGGKAATLLKERQFDPREYTLTALGQAAALCPAIESSLQSPTPTGAWLDGARVQEFLASGAYLLEQAGFTLLLPSWWTRKGSKNRLAVMAEVHSPPHQPQPGGGGMDLNAIVDFNWVVSVGGEPISRQELERLASLKQSLVRVRGQWVEVKPQEVRAMLALMDQPTCGRATLREVVQMSLGGGVGPSGLPFEGVTASGWIGEFLRQLQGTSAFEELPPPPGFRGQLRPYQRRGYSWLAFLRRWGLGGCLADDMGLGKTIQMLALLQLEYEKHPRPSLLICPTSVLANWRKEAEKFTPQLPVLIHHGANRLKGDKFVQRAEDHALVLTSYALVHRDLQLLQKVAWAGVILDEAQNIKNAQTKQAQAVCALTAEFRFALTGTPVENHVGDLWSISQFLNPNWLGTPSEFRKRFYIPIQAQQDAQAAQQLRRLTAPFLLRRLKTDKSIIDDLPEKLETKVFCQLTREQATLYAAVVKELDEGLKAAQGIQRKGLILATLTKLKQVCNHPVNLLKDGSPLEGRSGKLTRLVEMLEEIATTGERVLLFTQFTEMGDLLKTYLQEMFGREVLFLHGGSPREARTRMVERFQHEADGPRLFVLSLKAGGTGLNLTAASHVFHFDRWWNPAVEDQATDRAFRIGQKRKVQVHKFVCAGTVEEKIDDMIERKQSVAQHVVSAGEKWLTEMNDEQLRDLFALRQEAIGE